MVYAVIPAAGQGRRMGGRPNGGVARQNNVKKQFLHLNGIPLLVHTLIPFQQSEQVARVVLVVPWDDCLAVRALVSAHALSKIISILPGGATRQDSVQVGMAFLEHVAVPEDIVVVHDGVRPFVPPSLLARVITAACTVGGAVAALPVTDSLARVSSSNRLVQESFPRADLWAMQTPQAFRYDILRAACRKAVDDGFHGTDEVSIVTRIGQPIVCVEGSADNIKITTAADMDEADRRLREGVD